jgi:hypothetical protein
MAGLASRGITLHALPCILGSRLSATGPPIVRFVVLEGKFWMMDRTKNGFSRPHAARGDRRRNTNQKVSILIEEKQIRTV